MERLLLLLLVSFTSWPGSAALHLTSSLPDEDTVYACVGGRAEFPWSLSLSAGEKVVEIQWFYKEQSSELVALYAAERFVAMPAFSGRVTNVDNVAGLVLTNLVTSDSGNYTLEIRGHNTSGDPVEIRRTAVLVVGTGAESPRVADHRLRMTLNPVAVKDSTTGAWHLELTCGTFSSRGQPPVEVTWTTPSGSTLQSSGYSGTEYSVLIPNPPRGGNYSCRIPAQSPAAVCLTPSAPVLGEATLFVDETLARLIVLEAKETDLEAENEALRNELDNVVRKQSIRLVGSSSAGQGRVEILYKGQWGTVCDDEWDNNDASVVCAMLGYNRSGATAYGQAHFGQGTGPIWLDDVQCVGTEDNLLDCPRINAGASGIDCTHGEDAGVTCGP